MDECCGSCLRYWAHMTRLRLYTMENGTKILISFQKFDWTLLEDQIDNLNQSNSGEFLHSYDPLVDHEMLLTEKSQQHVLFMAHTKDLFNRRISSSDQLTWANSIGNNEIE